MITCTQLLEMIEVRHTDFHHKHAYQRQCTAKLLCPPNSKSTRHTCCILAKNVRSHLEKSPNCARLLNVSQFSTALHTCGIPANQDLTAAARVCLLPAKRNRTKKVKGQSKIHSAHHRIRILRTVCLDTTYICMYILNTVCRSRSTHANICTCMWYRVA